MTGANRSWSLAVLPILLACGSSAQPTTAAKKGDPPKTDASASKGGGAKAAAGAKAEGGAKAGPAAKAFDISKDKSGIIARSAAVLEASGAIANDDLAAMAHLSKDLPSAEALCKHAAQVRKSEDGLEACLEHGQHHIVHLGPEVYAELAACITGAQSPDALDVCLAAEANAESALHYKPHGDNLSAEVCETFYRQFEKLAMEDAGEQAEIVKSILTEVKEDVIATCVDHGQTGEIECAEKAKTLSEVKDCAVDLL